MMNLFEFKNIDPEYEEILRSSCIEIIQKFNLEGRIRARYQRNKKGLLEASVQAKTNLGDIYLKAGALDIYSLNSEIGNKIKSQLRSRLYAIKRRTKTNLAGIVELPIGRENVLASVADLEQRNEALIHLDQWPNKFSKVLIVDDDVDAILSVDNYFRKFGFDTEFAIEPDDATSKISSGKADLILLDWFMYSTTGGEIVEKSIEKLERLRNNKNVFKRDSIFVITYSSHNEKMISLPKSNHFVHLDHWPKPLNVDQIIERIKNLQRELL